MDRLPLLQALADLVQHCAVGMGALQNAWCFAKDFFAGVAGFAFKRIIHKHNAWTRVM